MSQHKVDLTLSVCKMFTIIAGSGADFVPEAIYELVDGKHFSLFLDFVGYDDHKFDPEKRVKEFISLSFNIEYNFHFSDYDELLRASVLMMHILFNPKTALSSWTSKQRDMVHGLANSKEGLMISQEVAQILARGEYLPMTSLDDSMISCPPSPSVNTTLDVGELSEAEHVSMQQYSKNTADQEVVKALSVELEKMTHKYSCSQDEVANQKKVIERLSTELKSAKDELSQRSKSNGKSLELAYINNMTAENAKLEQELGELRGVKDRLSKQLEELQFRETQRSAQPGLNSVSPLMNLDFSSLLEDVPRTPGRSLRFDENQDPAPNLSLLNESVLDGFLNFQNGNENVVPPSSNMNVETPSRANSRTRSGQSVLQEPNAVINSENMQNISAQLSEAKCQVTVLTKENSHLKNQIITIQGELIKANKFLYYYKKKDRAREAVPRSPIIAVPVERLSRKDILEKAVREIRIQSEPAVNRVLEDPRLQEREPRGRSAHERKPQSKPERKAPAEHATRQTEMISHPSSIRDSKRNIASSNAGLLKRVKNGTLRPVEPLVSGGSRQRTQPSRVATAQKGMTLRSATCCDWCKKDTGTSSLENHKIKECIKRESYKNNGYYPCELTPCPMAFLNMEDAMRHKTVHIIKGDYVRLEQEMLKKGQANKRPGPKSQTVSGDRKRHRAA